MNDSHFDPDDPRLTAYALGELPEGPDRAAVETWLAESPEARAALEGVRVIAVLLASEYEDERERESDTAASSSLSVRERIVAFPGQTAARWWNDPVFKIAAVVVLLMTLGVLALPRILGDRRIKALASHSPLGHQADSVNPTRSREHRASSAVVRDEDLPGNPPPATADQSRVASAQAAPEPEAATASAPTPYVLALRAPEPPQPPVPADQYAKESESVAPVAPDFEGVKAATGSASASGSMSRPAPMALSAAPARPAAGPATGKVASDPISFFGARSAPASNAVKKSRSDAITASSVAPGATGDLALRGEPLVARRTVASRDKDRAGEEFSEVQPEETPATFDTAAYDHVAENPFLSAKENPLSTFSIDVDTASYANVRRFIESGSLPPAGAVRIEELLNYFPFSDAPPAEGDPYPFALHMEAAACPWNTAHRLVRVGIKGREMARDNRPPSNLVFLLDVSGSMEPADRLPLVKASLRQMVEHLGDDDKVAIVVYAGASGTALPSTSGREKSRIITALDRLEAGGSTNGASGIRLAYDVARKNFIKGGVNRVILATDGDFNVGITNQGELVRLIEREAKSGVFLSVLGVGNDNYKDSTMQKLADRGNGNYAYIDRLEEGRKVLIEQMSGTLATIAKDVKIQVEFNSAAVASYRLIGYEKRMLRKEDFNDDRVDAGEIGAGHSVTALYEVVPNGSAASPAPPTVDKLKYQPSLPAAPAAPADAGNGEMLTLKMRYKTPDANASERAFEQPLTDHASPDDFAAASADFRFSAAVAGFGLVLRDSAYRGDMTLGAAADIAEKSQGKDPGGYRSQFVELIHKARTLPNR